MLLEIRTVASLIRLHIINLKHQAHHILLALRVLHQVRLLVAVLPGAADLARVGEVIRENSEPVLAHLQHILVGPNKWDLPGPVSWDWTVAASVAGDFLPFTKFVATKMNFWNKEVL
jgi:hypothetical protein